MDYTPVGLLSCKVVNFVTMIQKCKYLHIFVACLVAFGETFNCRRMTFYWRSVTAVVFFRGLLVYMATAASWRLVTMYFGRGNE